nr:MAG TPA: hypothetical protein [Caudoviricetes sp.]DAN42066.1 MAG TPA: hypothetical protein [Caudoviricetes sp.]DAP32433.1 MAG TPA: hypothetical protein [Caudoviricetes sp.]
MVLKYLLSIIKRTNHIAVINHRLYIYKEKK